MFYSWNRYCVLLENFIQTTDMKIAKKLILTGAVAFFTQIAFAQTLQDGVASVDSHKYAKAKQNYEAMIASAPTAENYFYLGNTYLSQGDPDFASAQQNFTKGLAKDPKSYLNKIGVASVKLGKGDKSGISDIQNIVKESKEKDAEVLYRAAEALTLFDNASNPDLAIQYLNKAIEKSAKTGIPARYYYTLGDAYRLKRSPGEAMTAYDKAIVVAKNKASVYTRMATLWMNAQQWQQAKENIDKAIAADPTYAPAYKASANYHIKYRQNALAVQDLLNYSKYADEDPYTQLEIAKLYFTVNDLAKSKETLDKIYNKIDDPIKYKLQALLDYGTTKDYASAMYNLQNFYSKAEKSRILPADKGLQGLILAGMASKEKDAAKKASMLSEAQSYISIAKAAKDQTFDWDAEYAKATAGAAVSQSAVDAGPTSAAVENFKKMVAANPKDTDALYKLANAYQEVKNWNGAIQTWQTMSALLPDWAPAYYSLGYNYQQAGNNDAARMAYEKYIATVKPADVAANSETLAYAYFAVAYLNKDSDKAKAKEYVAKALSLKPDYKDAAALSSQLNK